MLTGIRVIDFSQNLPGPYTTLRLAELGAEVIKVEPVKGDPVREQEYVFRVQNKNKKSIVLDLKNPDDQQVALDLIRDSQLVIESFRPGVMSRLGIGYGDVCKINPKIVYCSITGYGQSGSMHHLGSHDLNYMALSGVLSQFKDHKGKPVHPTITLADLIGGIAASESIIAALLQTETTGKGAYLDIALMDVMMSLMINHVYIESATGESNGLSLINGTILCYHLYETKDGRFISLAALEPKFWENFCDAVSKKEWINASTSPAVQENPIFLEIQQLFKSRSFHEWVEFSQKVDCCMTPVLETEELYNFPFNKDRELIQKKWGFRHTATRFEQGKSALDHSTPHPEIGQHSIELKTLLQK